MRQSHIADVSTEPLECKKPTKRDTLTYPTSSAYLRTSFSALAELLFVESSVVVERRVLVTHLLNQDDVTPFLRNSNHEFLDDDTTDRCLLSTDLFFDSMDNGLHRVQV